MKKIILVIVMECIAYSGMTQSVGIGTNLPHSSSIVEMKSTTQGMLIPRMTIEQRNAISSPVQGLMIYQTDSVQGFYYYNGLLWSAQIGQQNLILLRKYVYSPTSTNEIWIANIDGTNLHQVPVILPPGITLGNEFKLAPTGDKIIFEARATNISYIYSCKLDGSNVIKIIEYPLSSGSLILSGVY